MTDRSRDDMHKLLDRVLDAGEGRTAATDIWLRLCLGELTRAEAILGLRMAGVAENVIGFLGASWAALSTGAGR